MKRLCSACIQQLNFKTCYGPSTTDPQYMAAINTITTTRSKNENAARAPNCRLVSYLRSSDRTSGCKPITARREASGATENRRTSIHQKAKLGSFLFFAAKVKKSGDSKKPCINWTILIISRTKKPSTIWFVPDPQANWCGRFTAPPMETINAKESEHTSCTQNAPYIT